MSTVGLVLTTSSYRGPDFVAAADVLGVDLVIATEGSLALTGGAIRSVVEVDCSDPVGAAAAMIDAAPDLDAVVGVDDGGVAVAALVAQHLGLPHNSPQSVAATQDKAVMRSLLAAAGVAQPAFAVVATAGEALEAAESIGFPVVLKPRLLSASRGVIRADDAASLGAAHERVEAIQAEAGIAGEPMLVERFVAGPEIAIEGLVTTVGVETLATFDKPDPLDGPFFEETIYVTPSRHDPAVLEAAGGVVADAVAALGLAFGPIHAEVRLAADGPQVVEVAARSIGGLCSRSLQFGMLGQSLEVLLLRAALGMNRRGMRRVDRAAGAMMIPIPEVGILRGVRGTEAVAEVEGVTEISITVPIGRQIRPLPEGDRYLGFIIARGEAPGDVEASLREAHALLTIDLET